MTIVFTKGKVIFVDVLKYIEENILVFDGAMGTILQKKGLKLGENPEILNIENRGIILDIHKEYIKSGANVITTNTFGSNELKLKRTNYSVEDIIYAGVDIAKEATKGTDTLIALDIGPIGELLAPMGTLKFERAV